MAGGQGDQHGTILSVTLSGWLSHYWGHSSLLKRVIRRYVLATIEELSIMTRKLMKTALLSGAAILALGLGIAPAAAATTDASSSSSSASSAGPTAQTTTTSAD